MKKLLLLAAALVMSVGAWAQTATFDLTLNGNEGTYYRGDAVWTAAWCNKWKSNTFNVAESETTQVILDTDGVNNMYYVGASNGDASLNNAYFHVAPGQTVKPLRFSLSNTDYVIKDITITLGRTGNGDVRVYTAQNAYYTRKTNSTDYTLTDLAVNASTFSLTFSGANTWVEFKDITLTVEKKTLSQDDVDALQNKIDALFDFFSGPILYKKVGYPNIDSEKVQTLLQNYDSNYGSVTLANYEEALAAYNDVLAETNINLPEDGKAYTIKAVYSSGEDMLYYDASEGKIKGASAPETGNVFVCKKTGEGKFLLVNEYGKYLTWGSSTSIPSNTSAVVDKYSQYADVTIAKATPRTNGTGSDASDEDRCGLVTLQAYQQGTTNLWYLNYIHAHATNYFVESGNTNKWYDGNGNRTHMYRIEEVANYEANTLTFNENAAKEVEGKTEYVATFYTPYEVVVPENVTVYTAQQTSGYLKTDKVESCTVIPRNTGVIVTYNAHDEKVTFVPATEEANTVSEFNNLSGSSVVMTQEEDKTYYVLSVVDDVVGFYKLASGVQLKANRAFYVPSTTSDVQGFRLDFGGEQTTGVSQLSTVNCLRPRWPPCKR